MEFAKLVLEYVKAVLSPQVVAGVAALIFLGSFKEDIRGLLRRIAKIRLPGGSELSTSQVERASEESPARKAAPPVPPPEQVTLPQNLTLTPEQVEQIAQTFQAERAKAYLWEYRYLNYYLVPHTQRVLDWLGSLTTRTSYSLFDTLWMPAIVSAQERQAVIKALESHHLIQFIGDLIEVTPKGKEYIQWRGPIPAAT
jgi:hypothetical protein